MSEAGPSTQETFTATAGALDGPADDQYFEVTVDEVAPVTDGWLLDSVDAPTGGSTQNVEWSGQTATCIE